MPLITEFKKDLNDAIDRFSQKEGKPTEVQSQIILELKRLITSTDSAVHLRQEILLKLRKMPSKTFAFLPFVNDLPKEIRRVLEDPEFSENQLLIAGYGDLYTENKELRKANTLLREEFEKFKTSGMPEEIAKNIQRLTQENISLTSALELQEKQHKQEIEMLEIEKKTLEQSVVSLTNDKESLQTDLEKTKKEKQQLSQNYLQKIDENMRLKEENKRLKEELEAYRQNSKSHDHSRQNNFRFTSN